MNIEDLILEGENLTESIYLEDIFPYDIYKSTNETEYENWI